MKYFQITLWLCFFVVMTSVKPESPDIDLFRAERIIELYNEYPEFDPVKPPCAGVVAHYLMVYDSVDYIHTLQDLVTAINTKWDVLHYGNDLELDDLYLNNNSEILGFLVHTDLHIGFYDNKKKTWVDSYNYYTTSQPILGIYPVLRKL